MNTLIFSKIVVVLLLVILLYSRLRTALKLNKPEASHLRHLTSFIYSMLDETEVISIAIEDGDISMATDIKLIQLLRQYCDNDQLQFIEGIEKRIVLTTDKKLQFETCYAIASDIHIPIATTFLDPKIVKNTIKC